LQILTPIEGSSQIAAEAYDPVNRVLTLKFHRTPALYHYLEVPPEVHQQFMAAESKGKAFGALIKDKFTFQKVALEAA